MLLVSMLKCGPLMSLCNRPHAFKAYQLSADQDLYVPSPHADKVDSTDAKSASINIRGQGHVLSFTWLETNLLGHALGGMRKEASGSGVQLKRPCLVAERAVIAQSWKVSSVLDGEGGSVQQKPC